MNVLEMEQAAQGTPMGAQVLPEHPQDSPRSKSQYGVSIEPRTLTPKRRARASHAQENIMGFIKYGKILKWKDRPKAGEYQGEPGTGFEKRDGKGPFVCERVTTQSQVREWRNTRPQNPA